MLLRNRSYNYTETIRTGDWRQTGVVEERSKQQKNLQNPQKGKDKRKFEGPEELQSQGWQWQPALSVSVLTGRQGRLRLRAGRETEKEKKIRITHTKLSRLPLHPRVWEFVAFPLICSVGRV